MSLLQPYAEGLTRGVQDISFDPNLFNISELRNASVPYGSEYRQVVIDVGDGDGMDFDYLLGGPDRRSHPPLLPGVPCRATKGCLNFP